MTVSSVSTTTAPTATLATAASSQVDEAQSRFMTLLVAQMKNQDPLNPMDNAQMTSQIAQLQTASGINQLNASVQNLVSTYQSLQQLQSTSMLGRQVLVGNDTAQLANGQSTLYFQLPDDAQSTQVVVKDAAGAVVRTLDLGAQQAGIQQVQWDGKNDAGTRMADGSYTFEVNALRNGVAMSSTQLAAGVVQSVSMGADGVRLNIPSLGSVAMSDVKEVR